MTLSDKSSQLMALAGDSKLGMVDGIAIIQPALEPWPAGVRKIGCWAIFFYARWSSITIGIEVLTAGIAVCVGPLMFGFCHIDRHLRAHASLDKDQQA